MKCPVLTYGPYKLSLLSICPWLRKMSGMGLSHYQMEIPAPVLFFFLRLSKILKPFTLFIASQLLWRNFGKKRPKHSSTVLMGKTLNTVTGSTFWISQGKTSLSTKPQGCSSVLSREHSPGLPFALPRQAHMILLLRSPAILRHPSRSTGFPPRHTQTQVTLRASRSCECQSPTLISSPSNS